MTYNLRFNSPTDPYSWDRRKNLVQSVISSDHPDIIACQEIRASMFPDLESLLGGEYTPYIQYRSAEGDREGVALFVKTSAYHFQDYGYFFLSESPDVQYSRGWDAKFPRVAVWSVVSAADDSDRCVVINTHFDHKGALAQIESAKLLVRRAHELSRQFRAPSIFAGDFNVSPDHPAYEILRDGGNFGDSYSVLPDEAKTEALTFHGYNDLTYGAPIDFIFFDREITVEDVMIDHQRVNGDFASDHWPVIADLTL